MGVRELENRVSVGVDLDGDVILDTGWPGPLLLCNVCDGGHR